MGWVWRDEPEDDAYGLPPTHRSATDQCSTRKVVRSQCKTEEVEPGKFVRKCERTEEILRDCVGKPVEIVSSNQEYTEEDVTNQIANRSANSSFGFQGLRSDIEDMERNFFHGIKGFYDMAEEMTKGVFDLFDDLHGGGRGQSSVPSIKQQLPPHFEASKNYKEPEDGEIDLSGLAKDV